MRLLWILPLLLIGCATEQIGQQSVSPYFEPATNVKPSPYFSINGKPAPAPSPDVPTIRVAAPPSVVTALSQWLGNSNTLRVEKAMSIKHGDLTISIPDNASLSYTLSETKGEAVFNTPRPTITAKVFGFSVSPSLTRVELFADNTGAATVSTGPFTTTKKFTLDWKDTETAGTAGTTAAIPQKITIEPDDKPRQLEEPAPVELPIMYAFSAPNCGPCDLAKKALDTAKDLPFRVVWNDPKRPRPYTSSPCFSWNNGNGGVTVSSGWYSLTALLQMYTASMKPKAASTGSRTFPTTAVHYSNPWYEYVNNQRTNTSVAHLLQHHRLQPHEVEAYRNQPDALNRIHGWLHDNGR